MTTASETPAAWEDLYDAIGGQEKLADRLLVDPSTVWRWSRGKAQPSARVIAFLNALCDEHGIERVFPDAADPKGETNDAQT